MFGLYVKKAGVRPLSVLLPATACRHESCASSIASGRPLSTQLMGQPRLPRAASSPGAGCRRRYLGAVGVAASAITVQPVILALRSQRAGQRERLTGLAMAAEQLHRAPEAKQRIVVCGRTIGHGVELRRGARIVARVKERAAKRLADRSLLGLEVPRFAQWDDRRLVVAVLEQRTATLVEVIDALHGAILTGAVMAPRAAA